MLYFKYLRTLYRFWHLRSYETPITFAKNGRVYGLPTGRIFLPIAFYKEIREQDKWISAAKARKLAGPDYVALYNYHPIQGFCPPNQHFNKGQ